MSNAPITIRTTLNLTFHICSSCSFSTWHPWLCLLSSAFRSTSRLTLVVCDTFFSQMFFQCCWVSALSGSALVLLFPVDERTPWMDLQRTGPLLLWFISSASWLCLSQCYGHLFVTQGLSLMETLCTSVNQLTSFQASWILASSLILYGGLPLPASVILYPSASRITLTGAKMSSLLWESP